MKKKQSPLVDAAPEEGASGERCSVASGWPGLIFWLGPGIFRGLGYFALLLAGICMAKKDPFWIFAFELLVGHLLICAAEVIGQMNAERERASANTKVTHDPSAGRCV